MSGYHFRDYSKSNEVANILAILLKLKLHRCRGPPVSSCRVGQLARFGLGIREYIFATSIASLVHEVLLTVSRTVAVCHAVVGDAIRTEYRECPVVFNGDVDVQG